MLKISIPTPCHEDWDAMIPNTQGRHCNSCVKTVVDFTNMNDEEVKHFFLNKKEEKVCGRFSNNQLHRITIELPQNIFYIAMPVWKKFLAACLIVFSTTLFSCDTKVAGEVVNKHQQVEMNNAGAMGKSAAPKLMGDTAIPAPSCVNTVGFTRPIIVDDIIKGDIRMIPEPPREETGIIEVTPVTQTDTAVINKLPSKSGEAMMIKNDSTNAGTDSCNKQTFY